MTDSLVSFLVPLAAFARPDGEAIYDLEQPEHLGDAMLTLIVTELILDMFPRARPHRDCF